MEQFLSLLPAFLAGGAGTAFLAILDRLLGIVKSRRDEQLAQTSTREARIERADQTVWDRMQQQINAQDARLDELELENRTLRGERDQYKTAWEAERLKNQDLERRLDVVESELKQLRGGGSGPSRPQGLRPPR